FHVHLAKEQFVFCSAHFITFGDNVCEPLHGHNYRVAADLWGELVEHEYVVDFIAARDALAALTAALDHRVLLPAEHPKIVVRQEAGEVIATFEDRRWVFPAADCVLLPIANTTAELLARHLGTQLIDTLGPTAETLTRIEVAVDECDGQAGVWRRDR
ncbi:MAG: 6-carboxytetrahydropterin synthase, partial [Planctomycetota bacterium]